MLSRYALQSSGIARTRMGVQWRHMSFQLSDTQKEIQAAALQFSKEVLLPNAAKYDRSGEFPWEIVRQAHGLGFMNPIIPEKYGGPGMDGINTCLVVEALAYGCTGIQLAIVGPSLAVAPVFLAGTEEQKKKYLGMLAAEPLIASYAVTEPGAGSDVAGTKTRRCNGRVRPDPPQVAAGAVGLSWRALDESVKYAMERKAFGTPIANHQGVAFMLSDMASNLELARLITYRSAVDTDLGSNSSYFASIAKCFAADTANIAAANACQIFGGAGFNCDYPVEKLMRDAKIYQIYEGTSQIQRMVISRLLLSHFARNGTSKMG
ncbi:unnamed protein product [Caenorhabditis sp. 36 PRJEB53466]|nr:unnamed protein product [Caenorhabditis sp. 36 PRJEB53466]